MTPQELFELALSYYNGTDNIPQDYLKAYDLFLKAAEAGHIGSQSYLGRMLSMGEGVEKNYDAGIDLMRRAFDECGIFEAYEYLHEIFPEEYPFNE